MTVQDVMTAFPETVSGDTSIRKAALLMRDENIGAVPVVDDLGSLVGVVTDRDIVVHAVADGRGAEATVEECMSRSVDTVSKDTTVEHAMLLMSQQQIRRLPVVENGRLVGIVSLGDLAESKAPAQEKAETLEQVSVNAEGMRTSRPADLT